MELMHLNTNGGSLISNQKCDIPVFSESWFNHKAVTKILSYAEVAKKFHITYGNKVEDVFIVYLPQGGEIRFERSPTNLYYWKPPNSKSSNNLIRALYDSDEHNCTQESAFVTTLNENMKFYSTRQYEQAKRACYFYHAMGTPSINDLLAALRMNLIKNNPVTLDHIKLAEKIFGPNISTLKGKSTRRKPLPVVEDYIETLKKLTKYQHEVVLAMDGLTINSLKFLTTISQNLYYRTAHHLQTNTIAQVDNALKQVMRLYKKGGFAIKRIDCDNEFQPLEEHTHYDDVTFNFCNPQDHVPQAERNNRVIKERARAQYHRLPFIHLPRIMVKYLVMEAGKKMNFYPAKHGVSPYYSPCMIMHQQHLDYEKHCKYTTGMYVQASHEPERNNTNAPRTLDCIYLRYGGNHQGGHELLHLATNSIINRPRVTPIPIIPTINKRVHQIAEQDGMPKGLKIHDRYGILINDSAWTAGVDYDEQLFDDDDYDDKYDQAGNIIQNKNDIKVENYEEDLDEVIDINEIEELAKDIAHDNHYKNK